MACYVDPLFATTPSRRWPYTQACHLTCDTSDELHVMAARLGLLRRWCQHEGRPTEHYDLAPGLRARAIKKGCIEEDRHGLARRLEHGTRNGTENARTGG
jgi:hypothetical protein